MIKITTDSTSDMDYLAAERGVEVMPLNIILGDKTGYDGVDVFPSDVYEYTERTGQVPHTAARNAQDYEEFFARLTKSGDEVIHIAFSSELSTSCACARAAAEKVKGVRVIDSKNLSCGSALLVMRALDMVEEGLSADEIEKRVGALVDKVQCSFIVTTMEYLHKGGRCSLISSLVATALKLTPCLQLVGGKILVGAKYMGNIIKTGERYVKDILNQFDRPDKRRVFVACTEGTDPRLYAAVKNTLLANSSFDSVIEVRAGTTITCHCGKGTAAIYYINE